jgi:hypothetical protein
MDERTDRRTDGGWDGVMDRRMNGGTHGRTDGRMDGRTDGRMAVNSQPMTVGSCIMLHQGSVRSTEVRHMNLFFYLKSVLTYESHTYCTLGSCYDQLSVSVIPHFWLCLLYWQDLQDLFSDQMVLVFLSTLSRI